MPRTVERYQNPACGDTIKLRLFTYNSNNRSDVTSIQKIDIYKYNVNSTGNVELTFIKTIDGSEVTREETGQYVVDVTAEYPLFTIGGYQDVWSVTFEEGDCASAEIKNNFEIYSDLWFATPVPPIYDFNFDFRPNKIRKGSKRYFLIQITPNVPKGAELLAYYQNLAIVSDIRVSIEMSCGDCVPRESDLRLLVDRELVNYREKCYAYYFINTDDYDEGIYNIWFELAFGENVYVSEKNSFQVYN